MGFEGIIAKDQDGLYQPGRRSVDCQKKVFEIKQEFVIGGYRPNANDRVDSLFVGVYEGSKSYVCIEAARWAQPNKPGFNSKGSTAAEFEPMSIRQFAELEQARKNILG